MALKAKMSFLFKRAFHVFGIGGTLFILMIVWTFWYGVNSDRDDISPLLAQLIPAGHCACETATVFECPSCLSYSQAPVFNPDPLSHWQYAYEKDSRNEGLSEDQCNAAFPGLFEDVNRGVNFWRQSGNITQQTLDEIPLTKSMTRAMIYKGNLYVIASRSRGDDHRRKMLATLGEIHRALNAFPNRTSVPDIEFVFTIADKVEDFAGAGHPFWALTRKASEESVWLMPDFGFWAWDSIIFGQINELGSYDEIVDNALRVEKDLAFPEKKQKLIWRGKLGLVPKLRRALLNQSKGQLWSDVKEVNSDVQDNYISLQEHCKYQFIAHSEGRSYSASLKYRQACRSVILIHKLQWIQHHHYLLVSSGPLQNYVSVERDFSDLQEKMANLLAHPEKAQKIADNSVKTFRERYLTPAAEACYWRALWRGYAEVSDPPEFWTRRADGTKERRGSRYESFLLLSNDGMVEFDHALANTWSATPSPSVYGNRWLRSSY